MPNYPCSRRDTHYHRGGGPIDSCPCIPFEGRKTLSQTLERAVDRSGIRIIPEMSFGDSDTYCLSKKRKKRYALNDSVICIFQGSLRLRLQPLSNRHRTLLSDSSNLLHGSFRIEPNNPLGVFPNAKPLPFIRALLR